MEHESGSVGSAVSPPVRCRGCDTLVDVEDAQALRWVYWAGERKSDFPLCEPCARARFGAADVARVRTTAST